MRAFLLLDAGQMRGEFVAQVPDRAPVAPAALP
jgi:hypothetical protein